MIKETGERMMGVVSSIGESIVDKHQRFGNLILKAVGLPEPMTTREEKALEKRRQLGEQLLRGELGWTEFEEQARITDFVFRDGTIIRGETPKQRLERERWVTKYLEE